MLFGGISAALLTDSTHAGSANTAKIQLGQWRVTDAVIEMTNPALLAEIVARRKASRS